MSLDVKFSATDAGFTSTVSKVKTSVKSMDDSVAKTSTSVKASFGSMVKAGAALAIGFGAIKMAGAAIAGTFATFKEALDLGGTMKDLSARTGETAGNLMLLRRAFDNSGVGADKVGASINKLQKFMDDAAQGNEKNTTTLARLGLTMADMAGKTPNQQMAMLAEKLKGVTDSGERSAFAMTLFGRSGGQLLPLLADFSGEMQTAQDQLGSMPGVLDRSSAAFDNISDNIKVAKGKFLEFAAGLLEQIAPALELATDLITRFDAAGAGMKLGEILTGASNAMGGFTDALSAVKLGEFNLAFKMAFTSIKLQGADSINSIVAHLKAGAAAAVSFLETMFGSKSMIFNIIDQKIEQMALKFKLAIEESMPFSDADTINTLDADIRIKQGVISSLAERIGDDLVKASSRADDAFTSSLANAKQIIDTSGIELDLANQKIEIEKLIATERAKSAAAATSNLTIEEQGVKIAQDRLSHEERIKELDADIASAKRKGNEQELGALEAMKAFHLELETSKQKGLSLDESMANANKARQNIIDGVLTANKNELATKKEITNELQKQLGLGAKIIADANAAERKDRLDPRGRLEKEASEATGKGNFAEARRIGRQLEKRETMREFQEAFGKKEGGAGRNVRDIAKQEGLNTFNKSNKQLQEELMAKRQEEMKPGAEGKKGDKPGDAPVPAENLLQKAVDAIKIAVESLEKKLPMPALGF